MSGSHLVDIHKPWKLTRHETRQGHLVRQRPHSHACVAYHLAMSAHFRDRARRDAAPAYCAHMARSWVLTARAERLSAGDTFRPRLP